MKKVLVPLPYLTSWSLAAVYFALEFAKRNPVKVILLVWPPESQPGAIGDEREQWQQRFADFLEQGRQRGISLEVQQVRGDIGPAVSRLAKELGCSEIILGLPPPEDRRQQQIRQLLKTLREQVEGQIITVKPKEEGKMPDFSAKKY